MLVYRLFYLLLAVALIGCGQTDDTTRLQDAVPLVYVKRPVNNLAGVPQYGEATSSSTFVEGGDLYLRESGSNKSATYNLTSTFTGGTGDVSDPDASFDGKKLVFAMRCNTTFLLPNGTPACSSTWDIWEFDFTSGIDQIVYRRLTGQNDIGAVEQFDEVDPAYLPDGRIVFSSNLHAATRSLMQSMYQIPYSPRDEGRFAGGPRERASVLHVMNGDGGDVTQISFSMSHDRNPAAMQDGRIMFSRWDNIGDRSRFSIYAINPDGTGLDVVWGGHTDGPVPTGGTEPTQLSLLHPREMPDGRILTTAMPISGTWQGGALLTASPSADDSTYTLVPGRSISLDGSYSEDGYITTPYPLWDGSGRALVSYTPPRTQQTMQGPVNGLPAYFGRLLEVATGAMVTLFVPETTGNDLTPVEMVTDVIALEPRPVPRLLNSVARADLAAEDNHLAISAAASAGMGLLRIKSVYNLDAREYMGSAVMVNGVDLVNLPRRGDGTIDIDQFKTVSLVAGTLYAQRPARFLRVLRGVPVPPLLPDSPGMNANYLGATRLRNTNLSRYPMTEILGYAPVEPDGSVNVKIPADIPFMIQLTDSRGRAYAAHTSWMQLRPGEVVNCTGCHQDKNQTYPDAATGHTLYEGGANRARMTPTETMADTRYYNTMTTQYDGATLQRDLLFDNDPWATPQPADPGPTRVDVQYNDFGSLTGNAAWRSPIRTVQRVGVPEFSRLVLNYPQHIQPIFDLRCTNSGCHNGTLSLDLRGGTVSATTNRLTSYDNLMLGSGGRGPRVNVAGPFGPSRSSLLSAVVFNRFFADTTGIPGLVDHTSAAVLGVPVLTDVELRLLVEWMDGGAQYFNDPYNDAALAPYDLTDLRN